MVGVGIAGGGGTWLSPVIVLHRTAVKVIKLNRDELPVRGPDITPLNRGPSIPEHPLPTPLVRGNPAVRDPGLFFIFTSGVRRLGRRGLGADAWRGPRRRRLGVNTRRGLGAGGLRSETRGGGS